MRTIFFNCTTASRGPGPLHRRGFTITLSHTTLTRQDSSGRVIGPTQRPLPDKTQRSQQTDKHVPCGIRTINPQQASDRRPTPKTARPWGREYVHHEIELFLPRERQL